MAVSYLEVQASQDYSIDERGRWRGVRVFSSPFADLVANVTAIRALAWSVNSVSLLPKRVYATSRDPQCPGNSLIRAEWSCPEDVAHYQLGKAVLSINANTTRRRMREDLLGFGVYTDKLADGTYWRPINEEADLAVEYIPQAVFRLSTAYTTAAIDFAALYANLGKVNSVAFSINSKVIAGIATLKNIAVEVPRWYLFDQNSLVVPVNILFLYRKESWMGAGGSVGTDADAGYILTDDGFAGLRKQVRIKEYALHETDDPTNASRTYMKPDGTSAGTDTSLAQWRIIRVERPAKPNPADDGTRRVGQTADFSTLFNTLSWVP